MQSKNNNHVLIIGGSYTGLYLAAYVASWAKVSITTRDLSKIPSIYNAILHNEMDVPLDITHVIITTPPVGDYDPAIQCYSSKLIALPKLQFICYCSSTSVYLAKNGQEVNEESDVGEVTTHAGMRLQAEKHWIALAKHINVNACILRLAGIYGPSRSVFDRIKNKDYFVVTKANQYFNRIYIKDLVEIISKAMQLNLSGIFNVADDMPTPPETPALFAAKMLKTEIKLVDFHNALLSDFAASFYLTNKIILNNKLKIALDYEFQFPSYKEGLLDIYNEIYY